MLSDEQVVQAFRMDERAFTRVRKLPFPRLVVLLLSGWKKSLPNRINQFFHRFGQLGRRPSPAAFCKARREEGEARAFPADEPGDGSLLP